MSSGARNVADALVDLAAANVDNRGDVDDELLKTTERLINHNPSLVEWDLGDGVDRAPCH